MFLSALMEFKMYWERGEKCSVERHLNKQRIGAKGIIVGKVNEAR